MHVKFECVALAILVLLAFTTQNLWSLYEHGHAPSKSFSGGHIGTIPGNMHAKCEIHSFSSFCSYYHFTPQNSGVTWPWPRTLFQKFLRGHVGIVTGNMLAKFGVCSIRHFKKVVHWFDWLVHCIQIDT